jgi:phospholipid/cholesterol/gamma-HCH transport system substrate-binding protein
VITRRTRIQLAIFCLITLVGVSFVGAKYARLGTIFWPDHYTVVAHFATSGGIYQGGEVSYRGVEVGQVGKMELTTAGVDVYLDIDKSWKDIPANTLAVVGDRSAVGEQYVELQPRVTAGPYLKDGSQIPVADTQVPIPTEKLLGDAATTVSSVDRQALATTIHELGTAFEGTGPALQQILDTSSAFLQTADANFDTTRDLIHDGDTVLKTQVDEGDALRSLSQQLGLFTDTLASSNPDLIKLIQNGSAGATQLRDFLAENDVDLSALLSEALTTGQVLQQHIAGIQQLLVVYPYAVEGGFSVVSKEPDSGLYDAHFGLVLTGTPVCHAGYDTKQRTPFDRDTTNFNTNARCTEPATKSNPRGAQNAPRAVASYDPVTKKVTWGDPSAAASRAVTSPAPATLGSDAWKWLFLEPLTDGK